ncbi:MAG: LON peptidase substrate-binding domain-containing protein, partial [Pseudobdellovibrionaceae bacterium]
MFPLPNIVFYPSTSKPLNIFETRYIQMVQDAIAEKKPLALAFYDDSETRGAQRVRLGEPLPFVREIAGYGDPMILEKRTDDSMLVLVQSKGKVRLKE